MTQALRIEGFNFIQLTNEEAFDIDGGGIIGNIAAFVGTAFTLAVDFGAAGVFGATAAAICGAPAVATAALVVGSLCLIYAGYCLIT